MIEFDKCYTANCYSLIEREPNIFNFEYLPYHMSVLTLHKGNLLYISKNNIAKYRAEGKNVHYLCIPKADISNVVFDVTTEHQKYIRNKKINGVLEK
jgi:hypothetical protein